MSAGDFGGRYRGSQVTDAGSQHLKGLTKFQVLQLTNTQVTNAGWEHLKGLTNLHLLMLCFTRVTDAGVNELKKALPKCQVLSVPGRGRPIQSPR